MDATTSPSAPLPGWVTERTSTMGQSQGLGRPWASTNPGLVLQGLGYPACPQSYGCPPQYGQQQYSVGASQQYPGKPGTVTVQQPLLCMTPPPLAYQADDYLGYSIVTMLCCCLPIGIAALIYSILTLDANHAGDLASAERRSRTAKILNHVALGLGICFLILCIINIAVVVLLKLFEIL